MSRFAFLWRRISCKWSDTGWVWAEPHGLIYFLWVLTCLSNANERHAQMEFNAMSLCRRHISRCRWRCTKSPRALRTYIHNFLHGISPSQSQHRFPAAQCQHTQTRDFNWKICSEEKFPFDMLVWAVSRRVYVCGDLNKKVFAFE